MVKVLVVCSANVSRSQSLEHYVRAWAKEAGIPVSVRSAGANRGEIQEIIHDQRKYNLKITPSPWVDKMLREPELRVGPADPKLKLARAAKKSLIQWADVVLAADAKVLNMLRHNFPKQTRKVHLVTQYAKGLGAGRDPHERGMKDASWPSNLKNPPDYEPGIKRGTEEAKRRMLGKSRAISKAVVERWQARLPFTSPSARRKYRKLQRKRRK